MHGQHSISFLGRLQDYSAALEERDQKLSAGIPQNTDVKRYETWRRKTQLKFLLAGFLLKDRMASS